MTHPPKREPVVIGESEDADVLRVLVNNLREVLFVRDPAAGKMLFVNPVFEEIWGIARQQLYEQPRSFVEAVCPEDRPKVIAALRAQDQDGIPFELEYRIRNTAGEIRYIYARSFFVHRDGHLHRVVGLAWDLTARRRAEEELLSLQKGLEEQIAVRTAELERSLAEKDLLLGELHHRVKNNLQIVSSLLHLQAGQTLDPVSKAVLEQSRARIQTIALAHQHLYASRNRCRVDLGSFANTIASDVAALHGSATVKMSMRADVEGLELSIDRAVPFGLLLNELLTNAHRHAFPRGHGTLTVSLSRPSPEKALLQVTDDGIGFDKNAEESKTLGLRMVHALVAQIGGTIEFDGTAGTTVRVCFPS